MAQASDEETTDSITEVSTTDEFSSSGGEPLRLEGVTKTFANGTIVAAQDIDITIKPDEFVVLLGPSGCGKTTTLRCISGLEIPDNGRIMIGDTDITQRAPKDRDLAYVFQSIALFPHMSVRKNIRFGLDMTTELSGEEKEKRVQDVARALHIDEYLDRQPSDLSGGQQQRVSIGRAMVMEPAAFLLDEPFSNLDANLRDEMQTEVKKLQRELNRAMIFVTHDQSEAMTLADKIVIMNNGHVQQQGSPYEIYNDPANMFVAKFIGSPSTNLIDCRIESRGDDFVLVTDVFELPVSDAQRRSLENHVGESVTMGVRPDYIGVGTSETSIIENAEITLVEPEGSRDTVHFSSFGDGITFEIVASVPQGQVAAGEKHNISFSQEDIWVFTDDGSRLV